MTEFFYEYDCFVGDQWAWIQVVPKDVLVRKGAAARFDCVYQSADVLEWYFKETGPLENSTRFEQRNYFII